MVQCESLDATFGALADATRRGVLERLAHGQASVSDLAEGFAMTLTGMRKHLGVLEAAGLVATVKVGRVRQCRLVPHRLHAEAQWIDRLRATWAMRFDALDRVVAELHSEGEDDNDRA